MSKLQLSKFMDQFELDITVPSEQFEQHLALENNQRIFFSGRFGTGKTYFLEKFFEAREEQYLYIRLAPVNYPVASNEDIFEFIKYDIIQEFKREYKLIETLKEDCKEGKNLVESTYITLWLLMYRFPSIAKTVLSALPSVKPMVDSGDKLDEEFKQYEKIKEAIQKVKNLPETEKFIAKIQEKLYHERDPVTVFISEMLELLKWVGADKRGSEVRKKVLVIDDLDRIDPEHTFRLFNVFSSHFSHRDEYENKFGFDQIIFVGDIDNIRRIFHTRYGTDTDFTGYIDKFYSREIFYFDNREVIRDSIHHFMDSIVVDRRDTGLYGRFFGRYSIFQSLFFHLVNNNQVSIRSLKKMYGTSYDSEVEWRNTRESYFNYEFPKTAFLYNMKFFNKLLGDKLSLIVSLKKCKADLQAIDRTKIDHWICYLLPILNHYNHSVQMHESYVYQTGNLEFKYFLGYGADSVYKVEKESFPDFQKVQPPQDFLLNQIIQAIEILSEKGVIK